MAKTKDTVAGIQQQDTAEKWRAHDIARDEALYEDSGISQKLDEKLYVGTTFTDKATRRKAEFAMLVAWLKKGNKIKCYNYRGKLIGYKTLEDVC